jgi:hypothetical protein
METKKLNSLSNHYKNSVKEKGIFFLKIKSAHFEIVKVVNIQ